MLCLRSSRPASARRPSRSVATVKLVHPDRLAEIVVLAATCPDLVAFHEGILSAMWAAMRKRRR